MNNKIKDYIYIFYSAFLPFLLVLLSLKLNNIGFFNNRFYYYIIFISTLITVITFVWSLVYTLDDIIYKEEFMVIRNMKLALLFIFSLFYVPIHYIMNYYHKYRALSFIIVFINILSLCYFLNAFNNYNVRLEVERTRASISLKENYDYYFHDNLFKINVDLSYACNNDAGDYILSCEDHNNDSFIGAYSYPLEAYDENELNDIYDYHLKQTKGYIEEAGYTYEEDSYNNINILKYNDMVVYMTYKDYDLDYDFNNDLRLIIINEISKENINQFINLVNKIELNN